MSYNMRDPEEYALAMDCLAAGIGPTLGPQDKLRRRRRDRAAQLTRQGLESRVAGALTVAEATPSVGQTFTAAEDALIRRGRLAELERMRYGPRPQRRSPPKPSTPPLPKRAKHDYSDPDCAFPDWSEPSDDDKYDPASGLPYMPRFKISRRRAHAMVIVAAWIRAQEAHAEQAAKRAARQRRDSKRTMVQVAVQILEVGANKRRLEKAEIGPVPHGFHYIQLGVQREHLSNPSSAATDP
ncbi:hypothetical protein B0H10DRAFT_2236756 [Mycena sp. CBHHK59/15]|nr:hypothetical protein B0H10DRAFT_2236756 [Mycena sp. CBHHK59/15]